MMKRRLTGAFRLSAFAVLVAVLGYGWACYNDYKYRPLIDEHLYFREDVTYTLEAPATGSYFMRVSRTSLQDRSAITACLEWNGNEPCFKYLDTLEFEISEGDTLIRRTSIPRIHFHEDNTGTVGALGTYTSVELKKGHRYTIHVGIKKHRDELMQAKAMRFYVQRVDDAELPDTRKLVALKLRYLAIFVFSVEALVYLYLLALRRLKAK